MQITIDNLTKRFGEVIAVDALDLDIHEGEFVAFLGPSGCGKTTTLLMVAGIYKPSDGEIRFGERVVNQVPPRDRNIGMVFQSYALYPHMTVFGNIAYPLKLKGVPKQDQYARVQHAANIMGIGHLLERRPGQLSGGQQQRVALGRALVKEPDVLLFDEPLSNLDARLRLTMRGEIKSLQKRLGITSVYVTHDQVEALTMADRVAVMNEGQLQAFDTPADLYNHPKTLFIAEFVGNPPMNIVPVEATADNGAVTLKHAAFTLTVTGERAERAAQHPGPVMMGIRPEDMQISHEGELAGAVFIVEPLGRENMIDVRIGDVGFNVLSESDARLNIGDTVRLKLNANHLQFFDQASGHSLLWHEHDRQLAHAAH
ncbi:MAG: ABC transporter ATP-binding protein [Chloroflexi bacterium]|nr:ABC transporter ATP-binding protein [Chloroflexota bacterium]